MFEAMAEVLARGQRIEIRGFGSFGVKQRRARQGRNPKTGDVVEVAAKRIPFFRAGKDLRVEVNGAADIRATALRPDSRGRASSVAVGAVALRLFHAQATWRHALYLLLRPVRCGESAAGGWCCMRARSRS